jgi:hypothetical protein
LSKQSWDFSECPTPIWYRVATRCMNNPAYPTPPIDMPVFKASIAAYAVTAFLMLPSVSEADQVLNVGEKRS